MRWGKGKIEWEDQFNVCLVNITEATFSKNRKRWYIGRDNGYEFFIHILGFINHLKLIKEAHRVSADYKT